ncbi:MAG: TetR/AcrR family transcriptional regulator [Candidatus Eisenbacteria bacterium]|jgi:AcrR family transcriptional regulator|nr:TetR/AcrR family transcriptional regulator [Candidatus Eisenbacteria bacterium]
MSSTSSDHDPARSRKEREREQHRLEALHAAELLLERRVYHEITVQEIAAEGEFSVGYIYKLFENKEDVYASLLRHRCEELEQVVATQSTRRGPVDERITAVVRGVSNWFKNNPAFASNYLGTVLTLARSRETIAADLTRHEAALRERLDALFKEGMEQGVLAPGDPSVITATLRALLWGFVGQNLMSWFDPAKKEKWTDYAPIIVRLITTTFAPARA